VRYRPKLDASQKGIQSALEAAGARVQSFASVGHGVPDLYAYRAGNHYWFECKTPKAGKHKEPEKKQANWAQKMGLTVYVVKTPEEALKCLMHRLEPQYVQSQKVGVTG